MQYHQNGFRAGDPHVAPSGSPKRPATPPDEVDVLIVGCGPAGLTLAAQLARFADIRTCIIDQKPGPLEFGQADGIACRSVEMFEAFGFAEKVLREAYWVNETAFWTPDPGDPDAIARSDRIRDTEEGLSEFPHVILSQARVHDFFLEHMRNGPARLEPYYNFALSELSHEPDADLPNLVTLTPTQGGPARTMRARYVVGCDGARSQVRRHIGLQLEGDAANQAWGVMDVLVRTNFPDIRLKTVVRSSSEGSLLIIPREGGYLVRVYVEMDKLAKGERVAARQIDQEHIIAAARRILAPYTFEVAEVAWWSVYEIGQRLSARFDNGHDATPTVFIAGDAGHTHSPKAGQGMNVSMADAFNLGWKLSAVLRGQSDPALLATYSQERQAIAQELIDFDRQFAAMFSAKSGGQGQPTDAAEFQRYFQQQGRFTAGTATRYAASAITAMPEHQHLAPGLQIGMRFHSAPVIRAADAKPLQLGHVLRADGRWRILAFAGISRTKEDIASLCSFLGARLLQDYTPNGADIDSVIDLRVVLPMPHRAIELGALPMLLRPAKGRHGLTDYEKVYCPDPAQNIYEMRGIDARQGCNVIVRPDQHIAQVLPIGDHAALASFFGQVLLPV